VRRAMSDPRGRVIAVTGGARGIGRATAEAFIAAGATVVIGDVDIDTAAASGARLGATAFPLDVSDEVSFATFLESVEREVGPLDVLVNNAGIMPLGPLVDEPEQVTQRILAINLLGAIHGTRLGMRRMVPRGRGHIVNVASAVGRFALPHAATYSASKFGVVGLTQAVRAELRGTGVYASVVLPAITNTDLISGVPSTPVQRVVEPAEVAGAIVGIIRKPRFEVWVPSGRQWQFRVMGLLPYPLLERAARSSGATEILAAAEPGARADYERRVRGES
jgi:NAD(P)-dependent dehydrogenase (short-subunit alcohol dehydrogenase family)